MASNACALAVCRAWRYHLHHKNSSPPPPRILPPSRTTYLSSTHFLSFIATFSVSSSWHVKYSGCLWMPLSHGCHRPVPLSVSVLAVPLCRSLCAGCRELTTGVSDGEAFHDRTLYCGAGLSVSTVDPARGSLGQYTGRFYLWRNGPLFTADLSLSPSLHLSELPIHLLSVYPVAYKPF